MCRTRVTIRALPRQKEEAYKVCSTKLEDCHEGKRDLAWPPLFLSSLRRPKPCLSLSTPPWLHSSFAWLPFPLVVNSYQGLPTAATHYLSCLAPYSLSDPVSPLVSRVCSLEPLQNMDLSILRIMRQLRRLSSASMDSNWLKRNSRLTGRTLPLHLTPLEATDTTITTTTIIITTTITMLRKEGASTLLPRLERTVRTMSARSHH
jgi:hypothetical protein